jgi:hypothetical protein
MENWRRVRVGGAIEDLRVKVEEAAPECAAVEKFTPVL